jgi:ribosomal protein S18 acetylase RimI-like enzyme
MIDLEILDYRPEYQPYFERLNKTWLEAYFRVEPIDEYVLGRPEEAILREGGQIYFVRHEGQIIGTMALKVAGPSVLELTKMAVDPPFQGQGVGKFLCRTAIAKAREMGAHKLLLFSHTSLAPALGIYRSLGFVEVPVEPGKYARADIMMELALA